MSPIKYHSFLILKIELFSKKKQNIANNLRIIRLGLRLEYLEMKNIGMHLLYTKKEHHP